MTLPVRSCSFSIDSSENSVLGNEIKFQINFFSFELQFCRNEIGRNETKRDWEWKGTKGDGMKEKEMEREGRERLE